MAILPKKTMPWYDSEDLRPQPQIYVDRRLPWAKESLVEVLEEGLGSQFDIQVFELVRRADWGEHVLGDELVVVYERGTEKAVLTFLCGS